MRRFSLLAISLLLSAIPSFGQGYSHTVLIDSGTGTDFLIGSIAAGDLNNSGTVAFLAFRATDNRLGIFTTDAPGSFVTRAIDPQAGGGIGFSLPRINDIDQLTYLQILRDFPVVGQQRVAVAGTSAIEFGPAPGAGNYIDGNPFLFGFAGPDINNSGSVVFAAETTNLGMGIWRSDGGVLTAVEVTRDPGPLRGYGFSPTINNNGDIAYFRSPIRSGGGDPADRIMRANSSGVLTTAVQLGDTMPGVGAISSFLEGGTHVQGTDGRGPEMNDAGTIAFVGQSGTNTTVATVSATGEISTIVTTGQTAPGGGTFTTIDMGVRLNNNGDIVFNGIAGGNFALYSSIGGTIRRVIGVGDLLLGSTVSGVGSPGINDSGQIAFSYGLSDGRSGIAITGLSAPEPGTFSLVALAGLGAIALRRRRA